MNQARQRVLSLFAFMESGAGEGVGAERRGGGGVGGSRSIYHGTKRYPSLFEGVPLMEFCTVYLLACQVRVTIKVQSTNIRHH